MWTFDWVSERDGDAVIQRRVPQGLIMSEALTRASVTDAPGEHGALVELLAEIERGALDGDRLGARMEEEDDDG